MKYAAYMIERGGLMGWRACGGTETSSLERAREWKDVIANYFERPTPARIINIVTGEIIE